MTRKVAILIFDQVEVLDFCGPFEVFGATGTGDDSSPFEVYTVAQTLGPIIATNGLSVNPLYTTRDCPLPDILIVPGGQGTRQEMHNNHLIDWIMDTSQHAELIMSVCTGALLLAKTPLLDNLPVTTHHGALELLTQHAPTADVQSGRRYIDNGKIITSAGISAGIDASLYVVSRLLSPEVATQTARHMEYNWDGAAEGGDH